MWKVLYLKMPGSWDGPEQDGLARYWKTSKREELSCKKLKKRG
jgi:hypothetical protein